MRAEAKSTVTGTLRLVLVSFLISAVLPKSLSYRVLRRLPSGFNPRWVLVDVISQDSKNGLPVREFQKEDFRVLDNGNEVRITSFDAGGTLQHAPVHSLACRDL